MAYLVYRCHKGCDWILLSGVNTLPKSDRDEYRSKHDMVGMNRYIGRRVLLPTAIFSLLCSPLLIFGFFPEALIFRYGFFMVTIAYIFAVFSSLPKVLGTDFEK
jgi:uncharacterized membrane protein YphA (DoxX/SURF4 family)